MKTNSLVLAALFVVLVFELSGNVTVAHAANPKLGRVCVDSESGKIVVRAKRCTANEEELALDTLASKGIAGPQGDAGPKGDSGTSGLQDFQVLSCTVSNQVSTSLSPCPNDMSLGCPEGYRLLASPRDLYASGGLYLHTYYTFCVK